jgi:HSP20 family protein
VIHVTALTEPFPPWLRDLNRFFNSEGTASAFVPPADVLVDDDGVTVYMDSPGSAATALTWSSRTTCSPSAASGPYPYGEDGDRAVRRIERGFGRFERSLRVPPGLDPDAIEASLIDGVLHLRGPQARVARKIETRAAPRRASSNPRAADPAGMT